jgi:hypothetical protein
MRLHYFNHRAVWGCVFKIGQHSYGLSGTRDGQPVLWFAKELYTITWTRKAIRLARKVRLALLPSFWSVGYFDCDTARYHYWFPAWAWGNGNLERKWEEWDRGSDGPARVGQISFLSFVRWTRDIRNNRNQQWE